MKLIKKVAPWLIISTAMAVSACGQTVVKLEAPVLNEADRARFDCEKIGPIGDVFDVIPNHVFLEDSQGTRVVTTTADGNPRVWVAFDIADQREKILINDGLDGRKIAFKCRDNLLWAGSVLDDLAD